MYQFLCVLLFFSISIANCDPEHVRIVTVNIEEDEDFEYVECAKHNTQEKFKDGEQIQLVANIPNNTETIMRCHDENHNFLLTDCTHTGNQCTSLFTFNTSMRGKWQCIYLMDTNGTTYPEEKFNGKLYTKAKCDLNFEVDYSKKLECAITRNIDERLMYKEQFSIVATTPYNIEYMWCDEHDEYVILDECVKSGNQCTNLYHFEHQPGRTLWNCTYLLDTKGLVEPNAYVNGIKKYSKVTCNFDFGSQLSVRYRGLVLDIKVNDNGTRVECEGPNEPVKLLEGDLVHIEGHFPFYYQHYQVNYMRCQNEKKEVLATHCVPSILNCYSAFNFSKAMEGRWECVYEFQMNRTVRPEELARYGENVMKATCVLDLKAIDRRMVTLDLKLVDINTIAPNKDHN